MRGGRTVGRWSYVMVIVQVSCIVRLVSGGVILDVRLAEAASRKTLSLESADGVFR